MPTFPLDRARDVAEAMGRAPIEVSVASPAERFARSTIGARFEEQVRRSPGALAVREGGTSWTYAELDARANAIAHQVRRGIPREASLVALLLHQSAASVAGTLGVIKSGHAFVALDPALPAAWVREHVARLGVAAIVTSPQHESAAASLAPAGVGVLTLPTGDRSGIASPPDIEIIPDAPVCVVSTSGSTGEPKGVIKTHAGLLHSAWHYIERARITSEDRLALITNVGFMLSLPPLFSAVLTGASLFPIAIGERGIDGLVKWLGDERITIYDSVPTIFRRMARALTARERLDAIRLVRLGGETVRPMDIRLARTIFPRPASVQVFFGSSEASMVSQNLFEPNDPLPEGLVPLGRPMEGLEITLVGDDGSPVPRGAPGRMVVRGRPVSPGYWRDEAGTRQSFATDPDDPSVRTYRMSDICRLREDGMIEHLGRLEELAKVRGTRVSPALVESALADFKPVRDAAVVARPDASGDERLVAYVVPHVSGAIGTSVLRQHLASRLPNAMIPDQIVVLESLPLTRNGKVDRGALPEPRRPVRPAYRAPRDGLESDVANHIEALLGVDRVGLDDRLRDLGATSLDSVELLVRLERVMARRLPDDAFTSADRVEDLARAIADVNIAPRVLVPLQERGSKTPFFCVHPVHGMAGPYGPLARAIDAERPFIAIQSPALASHEWPGGSVAALARQYVREIRAAFPRGPYLLGGLCVGGLIAWEMARLLAREGEAPAMLVLIETWRSVEPAHETPGQRRARRARVTARGVLWRLRRARARTIDAEFWPAWRQFVHDTTAWAARAYRPGPYAGPVAILPARDEEIDQRGDQRLAMRDLATGAVRVEFMPGVHSNVCHGANVGTIARAIAGLLDEADTARS